MNLAAVELVEVSPRDGLQDHPGFLPTAEKVELIRRVLAAGIRRVEVTSFAHPDRVPALTDAAEVLAALRDVPDEVRLSALVLNERGLDRALDCSVKEVTMVVLATDAFSLRNQGMSSVDAVAAAQRIITRASRHGVAVGVTVAAAFGCPYEGPVAAGLVLDLVRQLAEAGPCEIVLADTIGAGHPQQVAELVSAVATSIGLPVRGHFHNTHGRALDNALAALDAGAGALDGSLSGLGGCPSAPGSEDRGNLASETFAAALAQRGLPGPDAAALSDTARWLRTRLLAANPAPLAAAGRG